MIISGLISSGTFLYLVITSLLVVVKNPKSPINISLGIALLFLGFWTIGIAGLASPVGYSDMYGRLIFTAATVGMHGLFLFSYFIVHAGKAPIKIRYPLFSSIIALAVAALTVTPAVVSKVEASGSSNLPSPVFGSFYSVFVIWAVFVGFAIGTLLIRNYSRSRGIKRAQALTILFSISFAVFTALITNILLPLILDSAEPAKLTPVTSIILAAGLSYAVLKHRFLDIRLVVARSVGYLLTLLVLIAGYSIVTYVIVGKLFNDNGVHAQQFLSVASLIFVALTFNPIKRFFDRLTGKFFFQDSYNPQAFFDELNKAVVATIELDDLLARTSAIVNSYLKSDFCLISIKDGSSSIKRAVGAPKGMSLHDIARLHTFAAKIKEPVIITEYIEDTDEYAALKRILHRDNIALMLRLRADYFHKEEDLGYIVLGAKKSGNIYNNQDAQILDSMANELVIAVQNALRFEQIEKFNITLKQQIEDATHKLRNTNQKLRLMDQTKDDFISMASHQLRTPLTSVKGYVSMVLDGDAGKITPLQRRLLNQSFISSQRMVYLISDLLNVSRLRTGKFIIEPNPCNLAKVIKDEIEQLQETAKGRNLELTYNKPEHFPTLMLDETKVRQVIMNFIDNAIYYTPSGGHISVNLIDKPKTVEFTVTDDGIGVSKDEQHHLFTKFFRAQNAKRARPDGTGLGLFMAKKVVIAQGGAIIFKSQENKGSTFGFTFAKEKLKDAHSTPVEVT